MPVSTNVADLTENYINLYDDVSSHVAIMIDFHDRVRIILGGDPPTPNNKEYFVVSGGLDEFQGHRLVMSFDNLEVGDNIWVRSESGGNQILVVRGNVEIRGNR